MTQEYTSFRQRLDAVLRTLDVERVRAFMISENQWSSDASSDEFPMWMMIAGSPTLSDLHEQALQWLMNHGHEQEAQILLGRKKKQGGSGKAGGHSALHKEKKASHGPATGQRRRTDK